MIVRQKRNANTASFNIEESSLVSTTTELPTLNNNTSTQRINHLFNSSFKYTNEILNHSNKLYAPNVVSNSTEEAIFGLPGMMNQEIQNGDTEMDEIIVNETKITNTYLIGNDQSPENLIWGIDNTVKTKIISLQNDFQVEIIDTNIYKYITLHIYTFQPILCQTFYTLIEYGKTTMFLWMFIEGIILYHMTTVAYSRGPENRISFYFCGWCKYKHYITTKCFGIK